eukprot:6914864-Alexandrium_andersonii.AAC.1
METPETASRGFGRPHICSRRAVGVVVHGLTGSRLQSNTFELPELKALHLRLFKGGHSELLKLSVRNVL